MKVKKQVVMLHTLPKNKNHKPYVILAAIAAFAIVAGIAVTWYLTTHAAPAQQPATLPKDNGYVSGGVNYAPPSDADVKAGDATQTQLEQSAAGGSQSALTMTISDSSQYDKTVEVRAYLTGTLETGGTCTAVLTRDGQSVSVQMSAFTDASSIQCGALDIPVSKFPASGAYSLKVTYASSSTTVTGTVASVQVTK